MDLAQQIKATVDIVQVVGERVRLKRAGARWVGLCPFHTEKTPSFGVNVAMQIFKCFGCGKGGSVIDFIMEVDGVTFWEACKYLAERHGIPLPKRSWESDEQTRKRAGLYEMNEIAHKLYHSALGGPAGADARAYLSKRGVTTGLIEEFGLGLADRSGQTLTRKLEQSGYGPDQLAVSGLAIQRNDGSGFFDRFRGRLMFPIHSEAGKVIGFAGRALADEDEPKYLNSPETDLYHKSYVLYSMHRARKPMREQDHVILVEGYMDVIGLYGGGVAEAVASCGTALVTTQARMMRRHTENIVVNFDPDAAGANAAERSIQMLLEEGMHIRVLALPGELDPDEFVQERGAEAYRELLNKAPRYFNWLADRARARFDMRSAEGRVEAVKFLLPSVQRLSDKYERAAVGAELAHTLNIDPGLMLEQVRGLGGEKRAARPFRAPQLPATERLLLKCLLVSEEARKDALPRLVALDGEPARTARIWKAMAAMGEGFRYEELEARLEEQDRSLLSSMVFADEGGNDPKSQTEASEALQAMECVRKLEQAGQEAAYTALKSRIATAEKEGRLEEALALSQELEGLGGAGRRRRRPMEASPGVE